MYEQRGAEVFLYNKLTAAGGPVSLTAVGTRVYGSREAPSNATLPLVLFFLQAGTPVHTMGSPHEVMSRMLYTVKAVVAGSDNATANSIAEAIFAALSKQQGQLANPPVFVHPVRREVIVDYQEVNTQTGLRFIHRGGVYSLLIHET